MRTERTAQKGSTERRAQRRHADQIRAQRIRSEQSRVEQWRAGRSRVRQGSSGHGCARRAPRPDEMNPPPPAAVHVEVATSRGGKEVKRSAPSGSSPPHRCPRERGGAGRACVRARRTKLGLRSARQVAMEGNANCDLVAGVGQRKDLKRPTVARAELGRDSGRLKPARRAPESTTKRAQRSCAPTVLACWRARVVAQGEVRWEARGATPLCCGPRVGAPGPCEGGGRVESA